MYTTKNKAPREENRTMKNNFEAAYEQEQRIEAAYEAAKATGSEEGKEKAREEYYSFCKENEAKGDTFCRIYREYAVARKNGNSLLDLSDTIWDKEVEDLVACLKENGIEKFTFSSTWSSAVETAWLFKKNGCRLEDLVEISGREHPFKENERETLPAYLFSIK